MHRDYDPPERVWCCGGLVIGGAVGTACGDDTEPEPLSFAGGAVATGVSTEGVLPPPEDAACSEKYTEKAATSANPTPASQRVVDEMRRMPLSRSTCRCGATRSPRVVPSVSAKRADRPTVGTAS